MSCLHFIGDLAKAMTGKGASGERPLTPGRDLAQEGLGELLGTTKLLGLGGRSEPSQANAEG